jgi:hypothetical protein
MRNLTRLTLLSSFVAGAALAAPPADLAPYFDPNSAPSNSHRVVGTLTSGIGGW